MRQRVTPTFVSQESDPDAQFSSASAAMTWIKTNWMYLASAIGVLIVVALLIYFYKKGMLFGLGASHQIEGTQYWM
jgi:hypothetical protein